MICHRDTRRKGAAERFFGWASPAFRPLSRPLVALFERSYPNSDPHLDHGRARSCAHRPHECWFPHFHAAWTARAPGSSCWHCAGRHTRPMGAISPPLSCRAVRQGTAGQKVIFQELLLVLPDFMLRLDYFLHELIRVSRSASASSPRARSVLRKRPANLCSSTTLLDPADHDSKNRKPFAWLLLCTPRPVFCFPPTPQNPFFLRLGRSTDHGPATGWWRTRLHRRGECTKTFERQRA